MNELKKASRLLLACAGVLVGCAASSAVADTVCAWNFNHEIEDRFVYKADHGIGSIDASASSEWLRSYSGTELGAHSGDGIRNCSPDVHCHGVAYLIQFHVLSKTN